MPLKVLKEIPPWLVETGGAINSLPKALFEEMCQDIVAWLSNASAFQNTEYFEELCSYHLTLNKQLKTATDIMNAISYILKCGAVAKANTSQLLSDVKQVMLLKQDHLTVLQNVWENESPVLIAATERPVEFNLGKLILFDWKLSIAMSSSSCKSLNEARVDARFKTADPNGAISTHSFSLTIPEFQKFSKEMKDMLNVLETV